MKADDSAGSEIRDITGNEVTQRHLKDLSQRQDRAQSGIGRSSWAGLALLILLVGVTCQARAVGNLFLAQTSALARAPKRRRQALGVLAPVRIDVVIAPGHPTSVATGGRRSGLFRMA